jgi:hypothetical protein
VDVHRLAIDVYSTWPALPDDLPAVGNPVGLKKEVAQDGKLDPWKVDGAIGTPHAPGRHVHLDVAKSQALCRALHHQCPKQMTGRNRSGKDFIGARVEEGETLAMRPRVNQGDNDDRAACSKIANLRTGRNCVPDPAVNQKRTDVVLARSDNDVIGF